MFLQCLAEILGLLYQGGIELMARPDDGQKGLIAKTGDEQCGAR
jgi:hypothetical protein